MSDSIAKSRTAALARMVSKAPGQKLGRTQVMKLFYFLQELKGVPLGYNFRLFTYGPFDSEVLSDLATACNLETVREKAVICPRGYGYEISPGAHADLIGTDLEYDNPELAAWVDEVVDEFGSFGAAELELRSTILFVDREYSNFGEIISIESLADRVRQIKPHFSSEVISARVNEMLKRGWLLAISK